MPSQFFTQSVAILFEQAPDVDALIEALSMFEILHGREVDPDSVWMGRPGVLLSFQPETNGKALVDIIDRPWPDDMGDPKGDWMLFGAWSMGWLGPLAYPGNLARALRHPTSLGDASDVVGRHRAFVRVQLSYVFGAGDDAPVAPPERDHLAELDFVTAVGRAVLEIPGALAWFDANGEVLHSLASLDDAIAFNREHDQPPLDLWTHIRMFELDDADGWMLMDTSGLEQLGVGDMEACSTLARGSRRGRPLPPLRLHLPGDPGRDDPRWRHHRRARRTVARVLLRGEPGAAPPPGAALVPGRRAPAAGGVRARRTVKPPFRDGGSGEDGSRSWIAPKSIHFPTSKYPSSERAT